MCNPRWHRRSRESTIKRVHRVTPDLIKHTQDCHGSTMRNVTFKHTPVRNRAQLTARSSSLRCVYRRPSTRLQNNTPKLAEQNPESISQEALYHETLTRTFSRCKSLRNCSGDSEVIFESNVTRKITWSLDSFRTVPQ